MRLAVLADIHGNRLALEAVLDDLRSAAPDLVVNLGDGVAGPFDPVGAAALQMTMGALAIAGNTEREMLQGSEAAVDAWAWRLLSPAQRAWVASLPATARVADVLGCHGSPGDDETFLLERIVEGRTVLEDTDAIAAKLGPLGDVSLVLCGHTHIPRAALAGATLVVNPGSVGLPAFRIPAPVPIVMAAGSPHARYALVTRRAGVWAFEMRAVAYDWDGAAAQAEQNGFGEVAAWTRTGRA